VTRLSAGKKEGWSAVFIIQVSHGVIELYDLIDYVDGTG
jgi:hypothetical protein